ncbi:MAG: hypothetical protein HYR85_02250 [Planctomycetes bacterium]|nr:hypothetical protein [Planctomycetota bacterium]MBI3848413.1 hypothetical protein [Planctomycetota bacterium]
MSIRSPRWRRRPTDYPLPAKLFVPLELPNAASKLFSATTVPHSHTNPDR